MEIAQLVAVSSEWSSR